jgi:deoxycytidylate deaminase
MAFNKIDEHLLRQCQIEGQKSPLEKTKRGALIAKGNKILGVGISARLEHGLSQVNPSQEEKYIATVRSEIAALGACIRAGVNLTGVTIYISSPPDWSSFKTLVTMGIKRMVFIGPLTSQRISHYASLLGIEILAIG